MKTVQSLLDKFFWVILLGLALVFFLAMAAGVSWGLPLFWNVDERLSRVMLALSQGIGAVPEEFYYPTLPFTIMLGVGKLMAQLGAPDLLIMAGIRLISVLLATLVIILSALMTLVGSKSRPAALIAALLVMVGSGFATIAHYAHVDIYLTFFMALVAFLLLKFTNGQKWIWLYISFFAIGLAVSSKYNGAILLLAGTLIAILFGFGSWQRNWLRLVGRMILAYFLAFLGFFLGTPKAILNAPSYLGQLLPFLERQREYAGPRPLGIVGQWNHTLDGLGLLLFLLFAAATFWAIWKAAKYVLGWIKRGDVEANGRFTLTLLIILLAFELPIAFSQFYPVRYMVPAYPLLAVLSAWMVGDLWRHFEKSGSKVGQGAVALVITAVIFFSALRIVSVVLLFANDGRIAAAEYLKEKIPPGSRTEHTAYPPRLPQENRVVDNYPLVVFKFEEDISPHTGANMGEEGIETRRPDFLVIDSKSYDRFEDEHVCRLNPVECQFFTRLLDEETNYELVRRFTYEVPSYLPQVRMDFVNVDVLVFERRAEATSTDAEMTWQNDLEGQFGQNIWLRGYDLEETAANDLVVTLYWSTRARMAENYKVFVHCLNAEGQVVTQSDGMPAGGTRPTEYWLRDEIINDAHILQLPDGQSGAECRLQAGLYLPETGARLPAQEQGTPSPDNAIPLPENR